MSRTITALFDTRSEADAAKARLTASRIDADNVRIIDQKSAGTAGSTDDDGKGFFAALKDMFIPDDDAYAYGEGIKRGGFMLSASVDDDEADQAIAILDESNSVDFDKRQDDWRTEGWAPFGGMTDTGTPSGAGMGASGTNAFGSGERQTAGSVDEQRIPIVEEELKVGKREVARGGARVRSYVRETPVHEQVSLREEHVSVERRPVDTKLSGADLDNGAAFQDRTIEMTETAEEAVVNKEARVREELVVKKTSEERVENIDDTVRRTEVEVDENMKAGEDRSAFGAFGEGKDGKANEQEKQQQQTDFERTDKNRF